MHTYFSIKDSLIIKQQTQLYLEPATPTSDFYVNVPLAGITYTLLRPFYAVFKEIMFLIAAKLGGPIRTENKLWYGATCRLDI